MSANSDNGIADISPLLNDIILHEDDLTEEAKSQFDYHTKILDAHKQLRRCVLENDQLTPEGRHFLLSSLERSYTSWKPVLNYAVANSEVTNTSLPSFGPLIICGLPRTGSTLLYNLLACDPNCRAPLYTDMCLGGVPPVPRSNVDEHQRRLLKIKECAETVNQPTGSECKFTHAHPHYSIEEDGSILVHAGHFMVPLFTSPMYQLGYEAWSYDKTNKDFLYAFHKTFLRMLNSVDKPKSHWLLKSPAHVFYFSALLRQYPQAALIMTHRSLDEVVPSYCQLASIWKCLFDKNNLAGPQILNTRVLQYFDKATESILEFRNGKNDEYDQVRKNIFDVMYDDLMKDPVGIVRQIYDHFGLRWSEQFESAMYDWLRENPQGKQGRHTYSLNDFDLTHEDIAKRYGSYIDFFLRSSSSS